MASKIIKKLLSYNGIYIKQFIKSKDFKPKTLSNYKLHYRQHTYVW